LLKYLLFSEKVPIFATAYDSMAVCSARGGLTLNWSQSLTPNRRVDWIVLFWKRLSNIERLPLSVSNLSPTMGKAVLM
jgi:hypothetical protein